MIFTSSWPVLQRADFYGELPVCPIRISRGAPKYWHVAHSFPYIEPLAPAGWLFGVKDPERFDRAYRRQLHVLGLERVRELIGKAVGDDPRPPCLMCFERDWRDCHRGQIAAVWQRWTGEPIYDLTWLVSRESIVLVSDRT